MPPANAAGAAGQVTEEQEGQVGLEGELEAYAHTEPGEEREKKS